MTKQLPSSPLARTRDPWFVGLILLFVTLGAALLGSLALAGCGVTIGPPPAPPPTNPPPDQPPPTTVCVPDLTAIPWAHKVAPPAQCSTSDQPVKHQPPGEVCPSLVPACPEPPEPEPPTPPQPDPPPPSEDLEACAYLDGTELVAVADSECTHDFADAELHDGRNPVGDAIAAAAGGCDAGRCVLPEGRQEFQARVAALLRLEGVCAGQHQRGSDEIFAATSRFGVLEGYHVYVGPEDGPGTALFPPQANRSCWIAKGAAPPPPPPADDTFGCPAPLPPYQRDGSRIKLKVDPGALWQGDATASVRGHAYCVSIGMGDFGGVPRNDCPVRQEGSADRRACERYFYGGLPLWNCSTGPANVKADNPALASCPAGAAWIEVCRADGTMCARKAL